MFSKCNAKNEDSVKNRPYVWKLNFIPLSNPELEGNNLEIIKYLKKSDEESTTYLSMRDASKAKLRGKCTALKTFIRKQEPLKINNLSIHIKKLEKEQTKSKLYNKIIVKKEQM